MPTTSFAVFAILLTSASIASAELNVKPDKDNVVSSRLEGHWKINAAISTRLGRNRGGILEFKSDRKVVDTIPEKYEKFLADSTIYMAGTMKRNEIVHPFILIEVKGNPHVVYFRERDGDTLGDAESFNVMLAVAKDKPNDLLFVGGDFNNQPFTAYERIAADRK
jgi:hypothetical protein